MKDSFYQQQVKKAKAQLEADGYDVSEDGKINNKTVVHTTKNVL